ncbi:MAG: OmpA family protein [Spirochaetaceae bacterium]|jgi:outer membrane protein OmpA-like peptidoglycan-associated protein|nr:OmpA family protein [Spirochaetaceae bacterium]
MANPRCIFFVLIFLAAGIYAQESKFSFGFGGEISGGIEDPDASDDTVLSEVYKSGGGGGWTGTFEYRINNLFAGGLKTGVRHDFQYWVTAFEQTIFARLYFVRLKRIEVFAEPGLGGVFAIREAQVRAFLDAYLLAGVRINLGNWYVEPYLGGGYPFWGRVGVMIGYRVPAPQPVAVQSQPAETRTETKAPDAADRLATLRQQSETPKPADSSTASAPQEPVRTILFPANATDFTGLNSETIERNNRHLSDIANTLKAHPQYRAVLEGHANPTEGTENEERYELVPLSRQRADTIADMLAGAGVDRKQLEIVASGGSRSTANSDANRRVEITIRHE